MIDRSSALESIKEVIKSCLNQLYETDAFFLRNGNKGVCERCLVFRLAHYLQNKLYLKMKQQAKFKNTQIFFPRLA
jgi:hypothetical protein